MSDPKSPARLLVFAHRGEARSFLEANKWSAAESGIPGHYVFENQQLLITGEGTYEVLKKLSAVCSFKLPEIVVNLGTCGALRNELKTGEVVAVRTAYGSEGPQPLFKSYTSSDSQATIDCISCSRRVESRELADQLANFASLVDREAWAVGSVAEMFKLSFYSYKLITDFADGAVLVSDTAEISEQLLAHYRHMIANNPAQPIVQAAPVDTPSEFYFTTSQRRLLKSLLQQLSIREKVNPDDILMEMGVSLEFGKKMRPKDKTAMLLQALSDRLSPFKAELRRELDEQIRAVKEVGWNVKFEPQFEDERIEIKATVRNESQLARLAKSLQQLPYRQIVALLRGETPGEKRDAL
ncbi:MAG: hypothetical protein ACRBF0_10375 [Calditrichia bacterium]